MCLQAQTATEGWGRCMCLPEKIAVHAAVLNHSREQTAHFCTAAAQLLCDHRGVTGCSEQTDVCTTNCHPSRQPQEGPSTRRSKLVPRKSTWMSMLTEQTSSHCKHSSALILSIRCFQENKTKQKIQWQENYASATCLSHLQLLLFY